MKAFTSRSCGSIAVIAAGALLLSACGTSGGKASLHDQLPEKIRKAGVIQVGASFTAAPVIFRNPQGQPDGLDPDIAAALEKTLGVKFEFQDVGAFSNVLPGLLAQKYDIGLSGITDTRERQQGVDKNGKQVNDGVDFVDYFMAGIGIVVRKGNPEKLTKLDSLCGRTVSVKKGTIHDDLATNQMKACEHLGKPLKVMELDGDDKALDELRSGSADAYLTDYPKAQYRSQTEGGGQDFDLAGPQLQPRPYGIALRKGDKDLQTILTKALNTLIANGTYDQILTKRQLSVGAVQNSVVNGS
ncbi:ABC transporter substrate-binding protein [Kitasatospora sp. GP82]|uniref:ABC transporter substrate-binding protein n=1 Tax=Kitasatospora sp. GP82 TaxID=3035089 RepID=UPI002476123A|nr:ABC transporter substrate-binding protein [Kitasatospora sp. GP82]MDH6129569.1 polar amino acid transport system substrate-binding protein [Kitasatospora sp. GP82]